MTELLYLLPLFFLVGQRRVPGPGEALQDAVGQFLNTLVMRERLDRMERLEDLREQRQESIEREMELEQEARNNLLQSMFAQEAAQQPPVSQAAQAAADATTQEGALGPVVQEAAQRQFQQGGPIEQVQAGRALGFEPSETRVAQRAQVAGQEREELSEAGRTFNTVARAAQGQQVDELPSAAEFEQASEILGVPEATRSTFRERVFATPSEEREQTLQRGQDLAQIQSLGAVQTAIQEGATIPQLARSNDPRVAIGAGLLGGELGTQVRQLRNKFTDEAIDNRQAVRQFWRGQAQSFIEERGLQGQVGLQQMTSFLRGERDDLPEEVEDALGEELEQFRNSSRLAARAASAGDVNELPTMQVIDTQINSILEAGTDEDTGELDLDDDQQETLIELFNQKAGVAEQELGIPRDDPAFPFPSAITEEDLGEGLFNLSGQNFQITTTSEGRALNRFILEQGDGSVDSALQRARQLRAQTEEGSADRQSFQLLVQQLERLKENDVDQIRVTPE